MVRSSFQVAALRRASLVATAILALVLGPTWAQDMLRDVDLGQPAYSQAEMTRADIEAELNKGGPLDLSGKSLNGLDLSGLDLTSVNLRAARLVRARLAGAKLDGATLDQAWLLEADLTGASLVGAHVFAAQLQRARADGADF